MKKIISLLIASLFALQAYAQTSLIVGTEPAFAPFEYVNDKTGKLEGFDIDIMEAVGKVQNVQIQWQPMPFDGIIPGVLTGTLDAAISGIVKNAERAKRLYFSPEYYVVGQSIMIRRDKSKEIFDFDSLKNHSICVQIATVGADKAAATPGAEVKTFNSATEAYLELDRGGCDAFITGRSVHQYYLAKNPETDFVLLDEIYEAQGLGIAMNKSNQKVQKIVTEGLEKIKANGEYQKIVDKWFKNN